MAASSSSSSDLRSNCRYDVFLSFRGEDTRHSFTCHLYEALKRAGIITFRDDDEIERGEELKPEIERAIKESRSSIIVLSNNFANSRWCLDELVLILEQRRNSNHFVLPVFYHVDPSDIRNQRRNFAIQGSKQTEYNMDRWRAALTEVANLAGVLLSGLETNFITEIVDTIVSKLDLKLVTTPAHLTGMETRAEGINSWLKDEQSSADVLAICGMGGSGKTTLAQYIYNSNKHKFECSSFLHEIGKNYKQPHGLHGLQDQLLRDIAERKNESIFTCYNGTSKIEAALQMKRVLIVLDDIDDHDQLDALLGTKTCHTQSKIIITTSHLDICSWFGSISRECHMYELKLMNDEESLELLSRHAFGSKIPLEGFEDLALQLAQYCEGNPLALKVLGSSLYVGAEDSRNRKRLIEIWISTMNSLNSLKGDLDYKILGILQRSFDSLPCDSHRELFLHIVFFFIGEYEDDVVLILERDWHAKAGIMTLINRCLLTVSPSNKLMMHQLLQDMGRKIVRKESKDPAERSRVWNDESYQVLEKGQCSNRIEGLALDVRKLEQGIRSEVLKTGALAKMDKLKLLQLKYVKFTGSYNSVPQLRWLCWHGCNLKTIPSGLLMSSLVVIDMSHGKLKKFDPPTVLNLLKILKLKDCWNLVCIHNLDRLPNLEALILWDCKHLTHVCETIGGLESLALLDLTGCRNLLKVSSNKKHFNQLQRLKALCTCVGIQQKQMFSLPHSLKFLFLNNFNFEKSNDILMVVSGKPFFYINLGNNLFDFLPNSIDLKMLRVLELTSCHRLKSLLNLPSTLQELYIYVCRSLEKITFQSARFRLREFGYEGCFKLCEVQGLFKLVSIENISEADLGHMKWIKTYQGHKIKLVGDDITKGRRHIQMLYEYGIMSTYLQRIDDKNMMSEYMSESPFLSFRVPLCPEKHTIQGLNVSSSYRSSSENEDQDKYVLFAKISNTTKGFTWIYNPVVYCKASADEDVIWLSYWPIGNILDPGDEVNVSIIVGNGLIVTRCGASLVYMDCELKQEENLNKNVRGEEVIGGDLSEFQLSTGVYYLCRRDVFKSTSPHWLKMLFGDSIHYTELRGWKNVRQPQHLMESFAELKTFRGVLRRKIVLRVTLVSETQKRKMLVAITKIEDIESICVDMKMRSLIIMGQVDLDYMTVLTCVRTVDETAEIDSDTLTV